MANIDAVKEKRVLYCKVLQKQGVLDGYGHLTFLHEDRILSTPRMPPGKVTFNVLIVLDRAGTRRDADGQDVSGTLYGIRLQSVRSELVEVTVSQLWPAARTVRVLRPEGVKAVRWFGLVRTFSTAR